MQFMGCVITWAQSPEGEEMIVQTSELKNISVSVTLTVL